MTVAPVDRPPFVDAHLHLWDRERLRYPWLEAPGQDRIATTYLIDDYRREAAKWNVVGCVHVEAGAHPDEGEAETAWLDEVAAAGGWPTGVVARVELHDPDLERKLAAQAASPRVRGVRHIVNWRPGDPAGSAYARDLVADTRWRRGYAALERFGLSFDFHGFPPQLPGLVRLAAETPGVPLVLDHLALPRFDEGLETWRASLEALAEMSHVHVKLSGAGFVSHPNAFAPDRFGDLVLEVIGRFGVGRVMVATNFPTDRLFADLDATLGAYESILSGFTFDERRDLWGRTADRFYRLGLDL